MNLVQALKVFEALQATKMKVISALDVGTHGLFVNAQEYDSSVREIEQIIEELFSDSIKEARIVLGLEASKENIAHIKSERLALGA